MTNILARSRGPATPDGFPKDIILETTWGLGQSLAALLRTARGLVEGGRSVDLTGLDRQIGLLCARTLDLQPELGLLLVPELVDLLRELDLLADALLRRTGPPATG